MMKSLLVIYFSPFYAIFSGPVLLSAMQQFPWETVLKQGTCPSLRASILMGPLTHFVNTKRVSMNLFRTNDSLPSPPAGIQLYIFIELYIAPPVCLVWKPI